MGRLEIDMKTSLQRCTFGRLPSNEVVLEHLSISRQHAQLTLDAAGALFITDLGSGRAHLSFKGFKHQAGPCLDWFSCLLHSIFNTSSQVRGSSWVAATV